MKKIAIILLAFSFFSCGEDQELLDTSPIELRNDQSQVSVESGACNCKLLGHAPGANDALDALNSNPFTNFESNANGDVNGDGIIDRCDLDILLNFINDPTINVVNDGPSIDINDYNYWQGGLGIYIITTLSTSGGGAEFQVQNCLKDGQLIPDCFSVEDLALFVFLDGLRSLSEPYDVLDHEDVRCFANCLEQGNTAVYSESQIENGDIAAPLLGFVFSDIDGHIDNFEGESSTSCDLSWP